MPDADDRILFENEAYRLTATGLQQNNGLSAELEGTSTLRISNNGNTIKTVDIPEPPPGYTGMRSSLPVLTAMYNLAIKELRANIHKGGLLLAGANWSTVWTRDIAYAAALGATLTEPTAVRNSLCSRVQNGIILQDTGTGGGWPISTDRVSWALGAWCLYQSTGDREWLNYCAEVLLNTLAQDDAMLHKRGALIPGETSFIDWREQSYPAHLSMAEIGSSYAFGTNVLHYAALHIASAMLREQGKEQQARHYADRAAELGKDIQEHFWSRANMHYSMFITTDGYAEDRVDSLATALAVFCGLAGEYSQRALNAIPRSAWGTPVFSPYKSDIPACYHNRAVWPFQEAFVLLAHAELSDTAGAAFCMASLLRAALAFGTNKENFRADNGDGDGTLLNSDRQLWSVSGMLGMYYYGLFGIKYEHNSLVFAPCVPKAYSGSHWLTNLRIRDMELNVHINGYGTDICSVMINGKAGSPIIPLDTKGRLHVEIELMPQEDKECAPAYPIATEDLPEPRWDAPTENRLNWHPVDGAEAYYIYADGKAIGSSLTCNFTPPHNTRSYHTYRIQAVAANRTSGFSSPYECIAPGARHHVHPARIGENAEYSVDKQQAWLNTQPCTSRLDYEKINLTTGTYRLRIRYCNATASKRDGDTCALRELLLNDEPVAIIALPHNTEQGRWDDYSFTAPISISVADGPQQFSLRYNPATCTNANKHTNDCMVQHLELIRLQ